MTPGLPLNSLPNCLPAPANAASVSNAAPAATGLASDGVFFHLLESLVGIAAGEAPAKSTLSGSCPDSDLDSGDTHSEKKRDEKDRIPLTGPVQVAPPDVPPLPFVLAIPDGSLGKTPGDRPLLQDPAAQRGLELCPAGGNESALTRADVPQQPAEPSALQGARLAFAARLQPNEPHPAPGNPRVETASVPHFGVADSPREPPRNGPTDSPINEQSSPAPATNKSVVKPADNLHGPEEAELPRRPAASTGHIPQQQAADQTPAPAATQIPAKGASAAEPRPAAPSAAPPSRLAVPNSVKPDPAREISLVVPGKNQDAVEVRVMERAGEVRVAVRTPDRELADNLRQDLGQLMSRLEEKGYHSETWRPAEAAGSSFSDGREDRDLPGDGGQGFSRGNPDHGGSQEKNSGRDQKDSPQWLQELEQTFDSRR